MKSKTNNSAEQTDCSPEAMDMTYSIDKGGLFIHLFSHFPGMLNSASVQMRTSMLICVTYVPMLILAFLQGTAWNPSLKVSFITDIEEGVRFLLVAPLLIAAEPFIQPWLSEVAKHARERLIDKDAIVPFNKLVVDAKKLQDSSLMEILLFAGTFCWQWFEFHALADATALTWRTVPLTGEPSMALLWYAYFAKPLFRFLLLRWLWRYLIWSVFLCRLSRLKLNLVPTHPDRHGGLEFIAAGQTRFAVLALALGLMAAAIVGNDIVYEGKQLFSYEYEILGIVALVQTIFLTPLLVFSGKLLNLKRTGLFEYGTLADEYAKSFHQRWIRNHGDNETLLGTSDIQSLADLDHSFEIVQQLKLCLIGKEIILTFAAATLIPFAPLLLTIYPFNELLNHLVKTFV